MPAGAAPSPACSKRPSPPWQALGAAPPASRAAIGPCIRQPSYEVRADLRDAVLAHDPAHARFFADGRPGHWQFDLAGYCAARLAGPRRGRRRSTPTPPPTRTASSATAAAPSPAAARSATRSAPSCYSARMPIRLLLVLLLAARRLRRPAAALLRQPRRDRRRARAAAAVAPRRPLARAIPAARRRRQRLGRGHRRRAADQEVPATHADPHARRLDASSSPPSCAAPTSCPPTRCRTRPASPQGASQGAPVPAGAWASGDPASPEGGRRPGRPRHRLTCSTASRPPACRATPTAC